MTQSPPAVILARPQLGQNIGACARAMLNFGLTDLRLVAPRDGWPNPDAGPAASGADSVLAGARVFDTVQAAIADLGYVYATTVRGRELTRPVVTPAGAATEMRARPAKSGLLFGAERSGLLTEELVIAHAILTIPVNPAFGSLNIAQAVLLTAYEWFRVGDSTPASALANYAVPAPHAELEGLIEATSEALAVAGYFAPPETVAAKRLTLRNLLTRPAYSGKEVRTLRGMITALGKGRGPRRQP
ncbi:RNA methyltransferase [Sphingosinicellaceae bacterium]|nr:RNA methyltransferase [Sphingosinicellaceae bacterium]